jgi:hypothetical protein
VTSSVTAMLPVGLWSPSTLTIYLSLTCHKIMSPTLDPSMSQLSHWSERAGRDHRRKTGSCRCEARHSLYFVPADFSLMGPSPESV